MKFAFISDTHDVFYPEIPKVDAIIHAGDITLSGSPEETVRFLKWYSQLDVQYKIFIGGNHDKFLEDFGGIVVTDYPDLLYLFNSWIRVGGYKVWGSPVSRTYGTIKAFALDGIQLERVWDGIPNDTDILVTHGPSLGYLDQVKPGAEHLGDLDLMWAVDKVKPLIHACGHIHGGHGQWITDTHRLNAAVLDEAYKPYHRDIIVLELEDKNEDSWGV